MRGRREGGLFKEDYVTSIGLTDKSSVHCRNTTKYQKWTQGLKTALMHLVTVVKYTYHRCDYRLVVLHEGLLVLLGPLKQCVHHCSAQVSLHLLLQL